MSRTYRRTLLTFAAVLLAPAAGAADNPFARADLGAAALAQRDTPAGKCEVGKCQAGKRTGAADAAGPAGAANGTMKCNTGADGAMKCTAQGGGDAGSGGGNGGMKCGAAMGMPGMRMDMDTMVMNEDTDNLPRECQQISEEVHLTLRAGIKYVSPCPGTVFGYDEHQWQVPRCARVTVRFINENEVRHQFMIHQLPSYLYPQGMFHLEADGGHEVTGPSSCRHRPHLPRALRHLPPHGEGHEGSARGRQGLGRPAEHLRADQSAVPGPLRPLAGPRRAGRAPAIVVVPQLPGIALRSRPLPGRTRWVTCCKSSRPSSAGRGS